MIEALIQLDQNYGDDLPYSYPWQGGHNSNSYARGLMAAAGLSIPDNISPQRYPLWNNPVSSERFFR